MSRMTVELLNDPELRRIADQAYADEMQSAHDERRRFNRDRMIARMTELEDWRSRALRAEHQLGQRAVSLRDEPTEGADG